MTTNRDHDRPRREMDDLLQRELDGDLTTDEASRLAGRLEESPEWRAERRRFRQLADALAADRIQLPPGFHREVMSALPAAPPWAQRAKRAWAFPAAAAIVLGTAALLLLLVGGGGSDPAGGLVTALGDFLLTTTLAGAGMLAASWKGLGMALGELLDGPGWLLFGLGVLALDLLCIQMLRRRRAVTADSRVADADGDG